MCSAIRTAMTGTCVLAVTAAVLASSGCGDDKKATPASQTQTVTATQTVPQASPTASPTARATITRSQAERIALKATGGGRVVDAELDNDDGGGLAWVVDVMPRTGGEREIWIDPRSGAVLANRADG